MLRRNEACRTTDARGLLLKEGKLAQRLGICVVTLMDPPSRSKVWLWNGF